MERVCSWSRPVADRPKARPECRKPKGLALVPLLIIISVGVWVAVALHQSHHVDGAIELAVAPIDAITPIDARRNGHGRSAQQVGEKGQPRGCAAAAPARRRGAPDGSSRPQDESHSFTEPRTIPLMKKRCRKGYTARIGIIAMISFAAFRVAPDVCMIRAIWSGVI